MKRHLLLLITVMLLSAASTFAQDNSLPTHERFNQQLKYPIELKGFDFSSLFPTIVDNANPKKIKADGDWYEPDTVWLFDTDYEARDIYTYNPQGYMLTQLFQVWQNDAWENIYQSTYTSDVNNNRITELGQIWQNDAWINDMQFTYTYDANNNRLTELYQLWQNDVWINASQSTYTYDANNNMLTHLRHTWQNDTWVNSRQYTYTYDANDNMLTQLEQNWGDDAWYNYRQYTYTYDANNNMLTYLYQNWQNDVWTNVWLYTYTYDANNNGTLCEYQRWTDGSWQPYAYPVEFYYNNMQSSSDIIPFLSWGYKTIVSYKNVKTYSVTVSANNDEYGSTAGGGAYGVNAIATVIATANTGYKFVNWTKADVEISTANPYSFTVTEDIELVANFEEEIGIEIFEFNTLKIYPNPTIGKLRIESGLKIERVVIYDIAGKIQKTENWKMESVIDISHLPAGVYFVKISTEAGEVTRKVLKE